MRDRPLLIVAARLGADVIDGFLDELKNSYAELWSSSADKSAERPFSISSGDLPRREVHQSRRSLPPEPSSRHVKAPTLKRSRALSARVVSMPLVRRSSPFAELSFLGSPDPLMSRRASRPSSTFFLPHQTKPKELP